MTAENRNHFPNADDGLIGSSIVVLLLAIPIAGTIVFGAVDPPTQGVLALVIALIAVLWAVVSVRNGELRMSGSPIQLPLIGLIVIGCIQLFPFGDPRLEAGLISMAPTSALSIEPHATRLFVFRMVFYVVFLGAALVFLNSPKRIRGLLGALVAFGTIMAVFGTLQRLAEPGAIYGLRPTPHAIPFASFVNQHHFASLMVMLSAPILALILIGKVGRDKIPLLVIGLVLMLLAILFTGSRGAMVAYVGMSAFVVLASFTLRQTADGEREVVRTNKLTALSGATAFAAIVFGLAVFLGAGDGLFRGILGPAEHVDITSGRLHFWKTGLRIFADNPVLGTGLDTFSSAYPKYDTQSGYFRLEHAHNDYLQTMTDSGLLGLACVIAFIVLIFRLTFRSIRRSKDVVQLSLAVGALAGVLGCLIHSFFDFPLRTPSNGFVFLLLVAVAVNAVTVAANGRER